MHISNVFKWDGIKGDQIYFLIRIGCYKNLDYFFFCYFGKNKKIVEEDFFLKKYFNSSHIFTLNP